MAWAADIAMFAIPTGEGAEVHAPVPLAVLDATDNVWAGWLNHIFAWQDGTRTVDILNLSVGYEGIIDSYSEQELRANFGAAIAAMAQADATDRTVVVWAAGNAHGDPCDPSTTEQCVDNEVDAVSVQVLPGLVARIPELQGHSIAVVALRADGQIADFSNRCGIAAHHCIAAPGEDVRIAYFGPADGNPVSRLCQRPGNVLCRALRSRRAGGNEAAVPRSTVESGTGDSSPRDGERRRHVRRPDDLRAWRHGSPRRNLARGRVGRSGRQSGGRSRRLPACHQTPDRRGIRRRAASCPRRPRDRCLRCARRPVLVRPRRFHGCRGGPANDGGVARLRGTDAAGGGLALAILRSPSAPWR